ncbi:hypothetical protein ES702_00253 [subsurface metagenome]
MFFLHKVCVRVSWYWFDLVVLDKHPNIATGHKLWLVGGGGGVSKESSIVYSLISSSLGSVPPSLGISSL